MVDEYGFYTMPATQAIHEQQVLFREHATKILNLT